MSLPKSRFELACTMVVAFMDTGDNFEGSFGFTMHKCAVPSVSAILVALPTKACMSADDFRLSASNKLELARYGLI